MTNAKMNFKITIKTKGTIAVIVVIALIFAAVLYFALADPPAPQTPIDPAAEYIGNKSTKKLHLPDCRYVSQISEKNVIYFTSKSEAEGYDPCAVCGPK